MTPTFPGRASALWLTGSWGLWCTWGADQQRGKPMVDSRFFQLTGGSGGQRLELLPCMTAAAADQIGRLGHIDTPVPR